jgi:hypothetical protein
MGSQGLRFIKEKIITSPNFENMFKFRDSYRWLIIVSVIGNIAFATLLLAEQAGAANVMSVVGTIEVYDSDGETPMTSYDFPLFTGGSAETFVKDFFVNNTGNQPVYVYWNISESSIVWEAHTPHLDMYDHLEDDTWKYSFGIRQDFSTPTDYWSPDVEAIFLSVGDGIKLRCELYYTGEPNTAETFTMTLSLRACMTITGDVNSDGVVDAADLYELSRAYGSELGKPNWNPNCDINGDGKVDASDMFTLCRNFGKTASKQ